MEVIVHCKKFKDKSGERVWFPKDGNPYFDKAFRRTFNNVEEKASFMNNIGAVDAGCTPDQYKREVKENYEKTNDLKRR